MECLRYHPGFGSEISSEALPGALPVGQVRTVCLALDYHELLYFRTILRIVLTVCIVSSCLGLRLQLLVRATGGAGCIAFVPQ